VNADGKAHRIGEVAVDSIKDAVVKLSESSLLA
jgi:hypothetical protein